MSTTSMEAFHQVEEIRNAIEEMDNAPSKVKKERWFEFFQKALSEEDKLQDIRLKLERGLARHYSEDTENLLETIKKTLHEISFFVLRIAGVSTPPNRQSD